MYAVFASCAANVYSIMDAFQCKYEYNDNNSYFQTPSLKSSKRFTKSNLTGHGEGVTKIITQMFFSGFAYIH